jgi:hypothetical protein
MWYFLQQGGLPDAYVFTKPHFQVGPPFGTTEMHFFHHDVTHGEVMEACASFVSPCQCPDCSAAYAIGVVGPGTANGSAPPPPALAPYGNTLPYRSPLHAGLVKKGRRGTRRFGVRLPDLEALTHFCAFMGIPEAALVGRFKVSNIRPEVGTAGILTMLKDRLGWGEVLECIYIGDNHAVVHASAAPPCKQFATNRPLSRSASIHLNMGTQRIVSYFKAMNSRARLMCEQSHIEEVRDLETANPDGDEWAEHSTPQAAIPRTARVMAERGTILEHARRVTQDALHQTAPAAAVLGGQAATHGRAWNTPSPSAATRRRTGGGGGVR